MPNWNTPYGKLIKGSKSVVCARVGGANTTSFLTTHFAKRNTKNCGGEKRSGKSEGGQKFLPPQPPSFLSARAEIIKSQHPDFLGKKFVFCSGQTATVSVVSRRPESVILS